MEAGSAPAQGLTPVQFRTVKVDDSAASFDPAELLGGKPAAYARKGGSWAINAMRDTAERLPRNAVLATAAPLAAPVGAELKVRIDLSTAPSARASAGSGSG